MSILQSARQWRRHDGHCGSSLHLPSLLLRAPLRRSCADRFHPHHCLTISANALAATSAGSSVAGATAA